MTELSEWGMELETIQRGSRACVLRDDHRECGSRGGQIPSPGGAGIVERRLLIMRVSVGS